MFYAVIQSWGFEEEMLVVVSCPSQSASWEPLKLPINPELIDFCKSHTVEWTSARLFKVVPQVKGVDGATEHCQVSRWRENVVKLSHPARIIFIYMFLLGNAYLFNEGEGVVWRIFKVGDVGQWDFRKPIPFVPNYSVMHGTRKEEFLLHL